MPRPHLLTRLNAGLTQRVTLLSAPAGFGKTTLVAQWLAALPRRAAWLSLDAQDSELGRFVRYIVAALHGVVPGLCETVETFLLAPPLPPAAYLADALNASLAELSEPLVLVLDDYHTVTAEEVQTLMRRLVQHLPAPLHLVVLSRVDPPWPLALWRARHWLREARAADLHFSLAETQAFFTHTPRLALAADTVQLLQQRTEGWVAGLQLAHISLTMTDNPEAMAQRFSATDHLIVDFSQPGRRLHDPCSWCAGLWPSLPLGFTPHAALLGAGGSPAAGTRSLLLAGKPPEPAR